MAPEKRASNVKGYGEGGRGGKCRSGKGQLVGAFKRLDGDAEDMKTEGERNSIWSKNLPSKD